MDALAEKIGGVRASRRTSRDKIDSDITSEVMSQRASEPDKDFSNSLAF